MYPISTRCEQCAARFDYYGGANVLCSGCVEEAVQAVKDFEILALQWKKGYSDLESKSKAKITELEQVIESLREEIQDLSYELKEAQEDDPSGWNKIEERERS